jgi:hypothetical protein
VVREQKRLNTTGLENVSLEVSQPYGPSRRYRDSFTFFAPYEFRHGPKPGASFNLYSCDNCHPPNWDNLAIFSTTVGWKNLEINRHGYFEALLSVGWVSIHFREIKKCYSHHQCLLQSNNFHLKRTIFWDITLCSLWSVNRRFGGTYRLYLQSRKISWARELAWKVAICSSETSVDTQRTTQCYIPKDGTQSPLWEPQSLQF